MATSKDWRTASLRAAKMRETTPHAVSAEYDRRTDRVVVQLSSGLFIAFSPRDAQGLEHASLPQLKEIEITPSGYGLHFPKLDADLYVPGLLEGVFGSRKWMAARLGHSGGRSRSAAKRAASRANGKLGGRPKKKSA